MILYIYPIEIKKNELFSSLALSDEGFPSIVLTSTTSAVELDDFREKVVEKLKQIEKNIVENDRNKFERISGKIIENILNLQLLFKELERAPTIQLKSKIEIKITKLGAELAKILQNYNVTQSLRYEKDVILAPIAMNGSREALIQKILDYQSI